MTISGKRLVLTALLLLASGCAGAESMLPPTETPAGATHVRDRDSMTMVYAPAGEFEMGSTLIMLEHPVHTVEVDGFWIDLTEVTNAQYRQCVEAGVCPEPSCGIGTVWDDDNFNAPQQPVLCVDYYEAQEYCEWVGARLPTEAEWEYAARGPTSSVYPWGNEFDGTRLNYCDASCPKSFADEEYDDGHAYTAPVGSYPDGASWCGALDMVGNVFEWTADWIGWYSAERQVNPTGSITSTAGNEQRVIHGGAWEGISFEMRGSMRKGVRQSFSTMYLGFRCASSTAPPAGD